ncbi:hypothetical protein SAMN05421595_3045 [Austwickia chelonae]|uniref:ESX-1 secretion-associated protein n=1 Tax=Austwickia chelonae NBRC 105200 TaxID=1184607 RepID=K6WC38_9MICO|nr:hypothetical protein [Austwickia chelonae]GAB79412.1 hypothetical protein AUCHE_24_00670 [Austwickia chelonae NBRC 105200]SEW43411.1 hypothetical protein SAMN05421595_3045 [Austwickia chelonae]
MSDGSVKATYDAMRKGARFFQDAGEATSREAQRLADPGITGGNIGEHYARYGAQIRAGLLELGSAVGDMGKTLDATSSSIVKSAAAYQSTDESAASNLQSAAKG